MFNGVGFWLAAEARAAVIPARISSLSWFLVSTTNCCVAPNWRRASIERDRRNIAIARLNTCCLLQIKQTRHFYTCLQELKFSCHHHKSNRFVLFTWKKKERKGTRTSLLFHYISSYATNIVLIPSLEYQYLLDPSCCCWYSYCIHSFQEDEQLDWTQVIVVGIYIQHSFFSGYSFDVYYLSGTECRVHRPWG